MQSSTQDIHQQPPAPRASRKRKTPPTNADPNTLQTVQHMMQPIPGTMPPGYGPYPTDFSGAGMPQNPPPPGQEEQQQQPSGSPPPNSQAGRALSSSKRAEQNRKAQRAFRERRDQHVKSLESRSQLLDAALASADEANRRWEECRVLVDQLRVENAALRAALTQQAQLIPAPGQGALNNHAAAEAPKE
ncbi:hypothetical protein B0H16DRAFT_1495207 [Mycena metata]|uniref:BZIP domain-containing protein n=1 Tax=Mycena metata TaxID=1033252 RepID=A0AAD7KDF9_9AGAR|nr:hypothetical protein B0H16DRAFT_1495207 [Mycena metata]